MHLFAETLSPSAAIIRLAYLLEEHARSLLCSSSAAQKAQPGEPSPSSLPSRAAASLLRNSVFPAAPHTFPNLQLQLREVTLKVRSVTGLLLLCQRETIFNQPEYSDHSYFSGEMPMHASA